jgi:hypothetical protein
LNRRFRRCLQRPCRAWNRWRLPPRLSARLLRFPPLHPDARTLPRRLQRLWPHSLPPHRPLRQ